MPDAVRTTTSHSGAASRICGSAVRPSMPGIERSSSTRSGWSFRASSIASSPSAASPTTLKPCWPSSAASASRVSGWSSTSRIRVGHRRLIGSAPRADKCFMRQKSETTSGLALGRGAADRPARRCSRAVCRLPEPAQHLLAAPGAARARHRRRAGRGDRRPAGGDPLLGRGAPARPAALRRVLRRGRLDPRVLDRAAARRAAAAPDRVLGRARRPPVRGDADRSRAVRKRRVNARGRALGEMLLGVAIVLALCWGIAQLAGTGCPPIAESDARSSRSS